MLKWSVELGEFDIQYILRNAIKAQVLADFNFKLAPIEATDDKACANEKWTLYVNGSANVVRGVGLILKGLNN